MIGRWIEKRVAAAVEKRGYAAMLMAGFEAIAGGSQAEVLAGTAVETAALHWGNALAAAEVTGDGGTLLDPELLGWAGRSLVRYGEAVALVSVREPRARLLPVIEHEVIEGGRYRVTTARPPARQVRQTVAASRVLHWRWAIDAGTPWEGVGPYTAANVGAQLAARIEASLNREASAPNAVILPVPAGQSDLTALANDIQQAKGAAVMAEGTSAGWDGDKPTGTRDDWSQRRIGPAPTDQVLELRRDAMGAMLAVAGVPVSFGSGRYDGTQIREDYRRFVLLHVEPMARRMEAEVWAKLRKSVKLSFYRLWAHDVQGRATALARLVEAGIPLVEARRLAGLA